MSQPNPYAEYGFEMVQYDKYSDETHEWSYKTCDCFNEAVFVRHVETGKMYKKNQSSRVVRWWSKHQKH